FSFVLCNLRLRRTRPYALQPLIKRHRRRVLFLIFLWSLSHGWRVYTNRPVDSSRVSFSESSSMARIARGLPTQIAAGVGRIIARWAYQEMLLRLIATNAANIN